MECQLDADIAFYRAHAFAAATKRTYTSHLRKYLSFCSWYGYTAVPASPTTLCRYAAYLAQQLSSSSIPQYLNIIRLLHIETGLPNPLIDNWYLSSLLKGISKSKGTNVSRKLPITPALLLRIRSQLNLLNQFDIVFWAACLIFFFSFLRKSNLLPPSVATFDPQRNLCSGDVSVHFSGSSFLGFVLAVKWSKTIQTGDRILYCPIPSLPHHPLCPCAALSSAFLSTRSLTTQAHSAFSLVNPQSRCYPLTYPCFLKKLRSILSRLGVDVRQYTGHSFRRGGASWALAQGLPIEAIKIMGDWKSDAYQRYLSLPLSAKFQSLHTFSNNLPTSLY